MPEAPHLADDCLRRANGGRARREDVGDGLVDGRIERFDPFDDLVDEPDPLGPDRVEPAAAGEEGARMRLADLGDDEMARSRPAGSRAASR